MKQVRIGIQENQTDLVRYRHAPRFAPAGQSAQMIVGASGESDRQILRLTEGLYQRYGLKRVFYSAYIPVVQDAALLESGAAIRTAEGGAEHVQPITGDNIVNVLDDFRQAGYTVVTTSSEQGKPLFKTSLPAKMVLVLGQEYEGLPDAARDPNDLRVKIDGTGNVAGLNISVATGVLLGEWWRQNKA